MIAELQIELDHADRVLAASLGVGAADDLQVLRLLLDEGPLRVGDLARRRRSSVATASARLDRLEKRGLLVRERPPGDRRAVVARLTTRGTQLARRASSIRQAAVDRLGPDHPIAPFEELLVALRAAGAEVFDR